MPSVRNRISSVPFLLIMLASLLVASQATMRWLFSSSVQQPGAGDDYQLLWKLTDNHTSWVNYRVSVEDYLGADDLKNLVCRVVQRERPTGFKYVRVFIYHSVDEYRQYVVDEAFAGKTIATYFWNRDRIDSGKGWNLTVYKDSEGREYRYEDRLKLRFDHTTECGQ